MEFLPHTRPLMPFGQQREQPIPSFLLFLLFWEVNRLGKGFGIEEFELV